MKTFTFIITLITASVTLLAACDSSSALDGNTDGTVASESVLGLLTSEDLALVASDLGVSSSELVALSARAGASSVNGDGSMRDPGALWALAAELHATMTDEQRARLLDRLEQIRANRQLAGQRGMRPGGAGQRGMGPGQSGQREDALAQLNLTPEQEEAIAAIREDFRARFETLRNEFRQQHQNQGQAQDRDALREAVKALRDVMHTAVVGVLTPDQAAELEELKASAQAEREARQAERQADQAERRAQREERHAADEAARIEALGLTAEQLAALDELEATREAFREEVRGLRDAGASVEEIRAAMEVHQQAHREAIEAVLMPEQLEITGIHRVLALRMAARRTQAGQGMQGRPGLGGQGMQGRPGFGGQGMQRRGQN